MHLVLVISSLRVGGAERVAVTMANALADDMQVTICTLSRLEQPFYKVSRNVTLLPLGLLQTPGSISDAVAINIRRVKKIRHVLKQLQPSVVVSFMLETNIIVQLASIKSTYPLVICEHTDPGFIQHKASWRLLRILFYWSADRVVVLNEYMQQWFQKFIVDKRVLVMPNPVNLEFDEQFKVPVKSPYILAAGRLVATKRFNCMIELFSQIAIEHPDWQLVIAGDGELKTSLQQQIDKSGLARQVHLIGNSMNLPDWMRKAEVFVSTSELEAFPMVICEAMLCETPVVISAYNDGAYKLIDKQSGIVTDNADEQWLNALRSLIAEPKKRHEMAVHAAKSMQAYRQENVIAKWLLMFQELGLVIDKSINKKDSAK